MLALSKVIVILVVAIFATDAKANHNTMIGNTPDWTRGKTTTTTTTTSLPEIEQGYVVLITAGAIIAAQCNVETVFGIAVKFADQIGIDGQPLFRAMMANLNAKMNLPYEHADIIPAVTKVSDFTRESIADDLGKDKLGTCSKWIVMLRKIGILE